MANQTVAVYLGNVIDSTYTGVYHVNVTFHFYPHVEENYSHAEDHSGELYDPRADLVLPISRNLPLNGGLWFEIENSTDVKSKEFEIPNNTYKAVLEVYVSFHENDEFCHLQQNGPFREVVVSLDDLAFGAVWPFTVIYTGGVNPFLWRPITGIGSFDLPSYDIEVDKKSDQTQGKLLEHSDSPLSPSLESHLTGFDGLFVTNVSRSIISKGWVKSSHGVITTKSRQEFTYSNAMAMGNYGNLQILNQTIHFKGGVDTKKPSSSALSTKLFRKFRLFLYYDEVDKGNETYVSVANVTLKINEKSRKSSDYGSSTHRLKNSQNAKGWFMQRKGRPNVGLGSTKQNYYYSILVISRAILGKSEAQITPFCMTKRAILAKILNSDLFWDLIFLKYKYSITLALAIHIILVRESLNTNFSIPHSPLPFEAPRAAGARSLGSLLNAARQFEDEKSLLILFVLRNAAGFLRRFANSSLSDGPIHVNEATDSQSAMA
ncbi:hypothetical protein BUALT_Bualt18G0042400 [Buddleja alternifolia]|uniref:Peptide N-acetyl-beta-D-glucosaminyl asparaginase amidase A N-terminal domain-containing protein n=1 Tax=Buddleja alternifolia TaxID=168488 RepID=A0AAV6WCY4_9LAMI|nr:hypothetical protein BUALT_Bualt18G0042400 [Buddleja alternifolia]